jgi:hypothetical protein
VSAFVFKMLYFVEHNIHHICRNLIQVLAVFVFVTGVIPPYNSLPFFARQIFNAQNGKRECYHDILLHFLDFFGWLLIFILHLHRTTIHQITDNYASGHHKQKVLIWNRHGHECSLIWKLSDNFIKKCRDFLGRDILGPNLVSFNRAVVPLFELSFLTKSQKLTSA